MKRRACGLPGLASLRDHDAALSSEAVDDSQEGA